MRLIPVILACTVLAAFAAHSQDSPKPNPNKPDWAYAVPPPTSPPAPRPQDNSLLSLTGSKYQFTRNKVQGISDDGTRSHVQPADWYPEEHGPMPVIVALGDPKRNIIACSLCHMPEGRGRTENAALAGLPLQYFVNQMHDMRNGLRQSAEPGKANAKEMADFARAMTEPEIQASAAYYSALPWAPWIPWVKVVETTTVPKTESVGGMWVPITGPGAGEEPIGNRIIEVPADPEATEVKRDPHSGFIAYVPVGAVNAGKELAITGNSGRTIPCAGCHGVNMGGLGDTPGIAGRTASYIARQLYDIQQGARHGAGAQQMKPVVAKLDGKDILDLAAYIASVPPNTSR